jgi:hypothetical protein
LKIPEIINAVVIIIINKRKIEIFSLKKDKRIVEKKIIS